MTTPSGIAGSTFRHPAFSCPDEIRRGRISGDFGYEADPKKDFPTEAVTGRNKEI